MIKVSVLYPNSEGVRFDMKYYLGTHIPLVEEKLGAACKGVQVEAGLGGAAPDSAATYVCMGHLLFDSVETYQAAFAPHVEAIMGDIPNYTNIEPVVQVSEIKL
jgi:uncharacterized protein (TIGR02118 family)